MLTEHNRNRNSWDRKVTTYPKTEAKTSTTTVPYTITTLYTSTNSTIIILTTDHRKTL